MTHPSALIPVFTGHLPALADEEVLLCDARELHQFLQVGRDYSSWIKNRIEEYGFIEDQDYISVSFPQNGGKPQGDRPLINYHLTLDTAKELAMVERNDAGRAARRYFIECEKALQQKEYSRIAAQTAAPLPQVTLVDRDGYLDLSYLRFIKQELTAVTPTLTSLYRPLDMLRSPETQSLQDIKDAIDLARSLINYLISQRLTS